MARDYIVNISVNEKELSNLLNELPDDNPSAASDFFVRFNFGPMYYKNMFQETLETGHEILDLCAKLNPEIYRKIHKGYPFYWMGMSAYKIHDYQSAIYYIDATLSEDLKNIPDDPDSPPRLFLRLEGDDKRQAARDIVKDAQQIIEKYINYYNQILEKYHVETPILTIDDVRTALLIPSVSSINPNIRSLASTFITFFLEFNYRDFQLSLIREPGTNEPFFIHLFKGCLLFESLLKNNPAKKIKGTTLSPILHELRNELMLPSVFSIGNVVLPQVLDDIVDSNDQISTSLIMTSKLRNTIGHNMGWASQLLLEQYERSFLHIGISCLHIIAKLFRRDKCT